LTKTKTLDKRQAHPLVREYEYVIQHKAYDSKGLVKKKPLVMILEGLGAKTN
jgi:hypothetical protein